MSPGRTAGLTGWHRETNRDTTERSTCRREEKNDVKALFFYFFFVSSAERSKLRCRCEEEK